MGDAILSELELQKQLLAILQEDRKTEEQEKPFC
jgi:hypothetical protein